MTYYPLMIILPTSKSISGNFSISESISPHPVLFMGLLKKEISTLAFSFCFCCCFVLKFRG